MRRNDDDDFASGCVAWMILIVFLMPLVGLYIVYKGGEDKKLLGYVLTIVGTILWIWLFSK